MKQATILYRPQYVDIVVEESHQYKGVNTNLWIFHALLSQTSKHFPRKYDPLLLSREKRNTIHPQKYQERNILDIPSLIKVLLPELNLTTNKENSCNIL